GSEPVASEFITAGEEREESADRQRTQILRRTQGGSAEPQHIEDPRQSSPPVQAQTMWPAPRMPTLKESDDIEHFLTMFERVAQTAAWPRGSWALHLVPLLDGKARAAYVAMDSADIGDYQKVKDAILRKYEINKDTYRRRFRSSGGREEETLRELYTRLKGHYEKWMAPQETSKEEIGDAIVLEQFLRVVKPDLRSWIIERSPESTLHAVEMAEAYNQALLNELPYSETPKLKKSKRQKRQ
uniref:SCAN box domain-containing protein n=1 Tax=Astyanax mexicanus TaxID=7994 RepID=A0A8B9JUR6_ASTMX